MAMTPAKLMRGLLIVALLFVAVSAASTEAQTLDGCEVSAPRPDGKTLWDLVGDGFVTGPLPALGKFASRTLGFGGRALEMMEARIYARTLNHELEAFSDGQPCALSDPESNLDDPILVPLLWDNAPAFQKRILGVVAALEFLPPMNKRDAQSISTLRARLMPTPLQTPEQIRIFIQRHPSGTRFIARDESGVDATYAMIEEVRDRARLLLRQRVYIQNGIVNLTCAAVPGLTRSRVRYTLRVQSSLPDEAGIFRAVAEARPHLASCFLRPGGTVNYRRYRAPSSKGANWLSGGFIRLPALPIGHR